MKIKSIKNLRWHYKTVIRKRRDPNTNTDFVGVYHDEGEKRINGLFELFHGDKKIDKFLPSLLKIAEDGQAIYEFLQNAVDCNSSHFFIFYNEEYFLAVNNGLPFNHKDILSILNIANTTKEYDCDKIGRFGIGFKLVHRLVGKNDGIKELTQDYKGPIIFSWNKIDELKQFLKSPQVFPNSIKNPTDFDTESYPWLFKILVTNFPSEPGEEVWDINYKKRVLFPVAELEEVIQYLKYNFKLHEHSFNLNQLDRGSLFFLKLGEGKKAHLDKDYVDLQKGVQYSMNFLKKLRKVYINDHSLKKENLTLVDFEIPRGAEIFKRISPEYKDCNIKISFGYTDYKKASNLRTSPNFYKYFPMGDETNGFSFIIHCDSFDIEANRRKLHESNKNKNLLPEISKRIIEFAEKSKMENYDEFTTLYANILVSKIPSKDNNKWLNEYFFSVLLDYIKVNIPTTHGIQSKSENVKIKTFDLEINLADLGLENIRWFYWEDKEDLLLLTEAQSPEKLDLEKWNIRDVFVNADLECFNDWIKSLSDKSYEVFLKDLDTHHFTKEAVERLLEAKLFKFSDGEFYSIREASKDSNLVFQSVKVAAIKAELNSLGFLISYLNISKFNFTEKIISNLKSDEELYKEIAKRTSIKNELTTVQKLNLFKNFITPETKFTGVADETLKQLKMFCDSQGNILSLRELLPSNLNTPNWLLPFKIHTNEYDDVLKKYLLQEKEIYTSLILPNWETIIENIQEPKPFYEKVIHYFNLEENNAPLSKQSFIFTKNGFKKSSGVFYNRHFPQNSNYSYFQSAIEKFLELDIPSKSIVSFLKDVPFKLDNTNLFDHEIIIDVSFDIEEIKALVAFTISNNENFFEKFYIEKSDNEFLISEKSNGVFQYYTDKTNKKLIKFLSNNYLETFKLLPKELSGYKGLIGILSEDHLYNKILDFVDVDENIGELIDLIRYNGPKRKLLLQLSKISLTVGQPYEVDSLEYKILDLACKELTKEQQEQFRKKVVLEVENYTFKLSDIPASNDEITFENGVFKLSLAQILPNKFENSDFLNKIINYFSNLGIPEAGLKALLGIRKEPNYDSILNSIGNNIDNSHQLAFILLYHKNITNINFAEYNIETLEGEFTLEYTYYTKPYSFIHASATLSDKYKSISKIFELPVDIDKKAGTQIISEPFFTDNKFVSEYLKSELDDKQRLDLIKFIFDKWQKNKKTFIKNIDWETINNVETSILLGFNPNLSVYPNEFSLKEEQLPEYLSEWIIEIEEATKFISDLKVQTESSLTVALRKYFRNNGDFKISRIAIEGNEELLFNTFNWMKENEIKFQSSESQKVFEEMVNVINNKRKERNQSELILQSEFDFEKLQELSKELEDEYYTKWKEFLDDKYSIYLFNGKLPKTINLNEIENYIFGEDYSSEDITISNNNIIYINKEKDIQELLYVLIIQNKISTEELFRLHRIKDEVNKSGEIEELKAKVKQLEEKIKLLTPDDDRDPNDITISSDKYTNEIKECSERYLFNYLKKHFPKLNITWLNVDKNENFVESWSNYDFEIKDKKGKVINYIDCKGTPKSKRTFYLTKNEWEFFLDNTDKYQIYRVFNVGGTENVFIIDNLLKWIIEGKVVPYLEATETIKARRVFLTIK